VASPNLAPWHLAPALRDELRQIVREIVREELRPHRPKPDAAMTDLLRAIHAAMGTDFRFMCADLVEAAELPQFAALRAAIGSMSPRRIGKALRAMQNAVDFDHILADTVDGEKRKARKHQFARAHLASGPATVRKLGQGSDAFVDG